MPAVAPAQTRGPIMRFAFGLAATAFLFLLGSNVVASTAGAPPPSNATEAPTETYATLNTSAEADRVGQINECVAAAPGHLPAGTDANAFCTCAVDKMTGAGIPYHTAIFQCVAELHVDATVFRAAEIRDCVNGAPGQLPAGTDANVFCSCAIDKMMAHDTSPPDAIQQCAAELHVTLPNPQ